jgi:mono/diheme cytochrome c family protein
MRPHGSVLQYDHSPGGGREVRDADQGSSRLGGSRRAAAAGREIATKWCSRCHDVEPGGGFKQQPPAFAAIAVYRSPERILGTIVAPTMHSGMPELVQILGLNAADLTAYIVSLEATAPR